MEQGLPKQAVREVMQWVFRSLGDSIDTSSAHGKLVLQILGAIGEFERSIVRTRTVQRLQAARERDRVGGNPGLPAFADAAMTLDGSNEPGDIALVYQGIGRSGPDGPSSLLSECQ